jgi:hypothetical protein
MAPHAVALLLLAFAPVSPDARIAASAAAAEALQGPLDGAWALTDAGGRTLYVLQIVDPVGGRARLQAAWRRPDGARTGFVEAADRAAGRLTLRFTDQGAAVKLVLRRRDRARWSGELRRGHERRAVTMLRR